MGGCSSENPGIADIIQQLTTMSKACPQQQYVLTGLSQGGVVTARALNQMPKELLDRILAVTMFMSPKCPAVVKDKCKSYCNNDIVSDRTLNLTKN
jgi:alpha-beta hydrolase superfamily lysophospholipase